MFNAKNWKPVLALVVALLFFPGSGNAETGLPALINEMIEKCFKDPDSGYADKKITSLKLWMSNIEKASSAAAQANNLELSGFASYKFKWKLIDSPKNEWRDDMATFYILIQHGQFKFSKGFRPAKCEYTKMLSLPKTEPQKEKPITERPHQYRAPAFQPTE